MDPNPKYAEAVAELQEQGLTVRLHSRENDTWHIADGGVYSGCIASGDELLELRQANNLDIGGIKESGLAKTACQERTMMKAGPKPNLDINLARG